MGLVLEPRLRGLVWYRGLAVACVGGQGGVGPVSQSEVRLLLSGAWLCSGSGRLPWAWRCLGAGVSAGACTSGANALQLQCTCIRVAAQIDRWCAQVSFCAGPPAGYDSGSFCALYLRRHWFGMLSRVAPVRASPADGASVHLARMCMAPLHGAVPEKDSIDDWMSFRRSFCFKDERSAAFGPWGGGPVPGLRAIDRTASRA